MPCTAEFTRWQDKYELWQIADADADHALRAYLAADALAGATCAWAASTLGGGGWTAAGCVGAVVALAIAGSNLETAIEKYNIRAKSADAAAAAYNKCVAACRRPPS